MNGQLRETVNHTEAMLNRCARDIAAHVMAGDTTSDSFAVITRLYRKLDEELAEAKQLVECEHRSSHVM